MSKLTSVPPGPRAREGTHSLQLHITTDGVPERDRLELWTDAIFSTLAIAVQPMANTDGPYTKGDFRRVPVDHC